VRSRNPLARGAGRPLVITVPGAHAWLLADPDTFGEVITNVISAASLGR
jgi:hypothetical protein